MTPRELFRLRRTRVAERPHATPLVTGNGTVSFALATTSADGTDFTSSEGTAANRPQLVITDILITNPATTPACGAAVSAAGATPTTGVIPPATPTNGGTTTGGTTTTGGPRHESSRTDASSVKPVMR